MKNFALLLIITFCSIETSGQAILGGQVSADNPGYVVSIHSSFGYVGTGVILDPKTIVTVAHITDNFTPQCQHCLTVKAGSKFMTVSTQSISSSEIILHPDYTIFEKDHPLSDAAYDVAIIKLEDPLIFDSDVQPLPIAKSCIFDDNSLSAGVPTTIFGWGRSDLTSTLNSNSLRQANANIYDLVGSQFWLDEPFYQEQYDGRSMLTIYSATSQAFFGDSGGPCVTEVNGSEYLAGLVSWGIDPNESNNSTIFYPSVMVDVYKMRNFILAHVESGTDPCDISGPSLDEMEVSITCGEAALDLDILFSGSVPAGHELRWSLDPDPSDCVEPIAGGLAVVSGVYYAYFYSLENDCYSNPSLPIMVSLGCSSPNDRVVSETTSLFSDQTYNSIRITNGATLLVPANITLSIIDDIRVERGSKLVVDGGTIGSCPSCPKWQGVVIEGIENGVGFGSGGQVEILNGGTIENARVGIEKVNQITSGSFGLSMTVSVGKLTMTSGASIRLCDIGVKLNSTASSLVFGPGQESSTIDDAFFTDNETAIVLNNNHGLTLNRNTFEYNHFGIEVTNSSADFFDNNFFDSQVSIYINALYPSLAGIRIERNNFADGFGVFTETLNNAEFLFINQNVCVNASIYTHGLADYQVTSNDIVGCFRGMEFSATGADNSNMLASNSFSDNYTGINVDGPNNMEFLSNCFAITDRGDIGLGYGTSIREAQGNDAVEAGNCFDPGSRLQTVDNDPDLRFTYFKFPQPGGSTNPDCKEPKQNSAGQNYDVRDAENAIVESCGSGVSIFGSSPNFIMEHIDCRAFIRNNSEDRDALLDLIASLEREITRLEQQVMSGQMHDFITRPLIAKYEECIDRAKKVAMIGILAEPTENAKEDAVRYLVDDHDFTFNIMAYSLMMSGQEYERALSYLSTLSPSSEDEYDFIDVQSIYHSYLSAREEFVLSDNDRGIIYDAGMKRLELAGFARRVFYELTGERIFLDVPMYDAPRGEERQISNRNRSQEVSIYPNPSLESEDINIEVDLATEVGTTYSVKVYSAQGMLLTANKLEREKQTISLPNANGLLFVTVQKNGEVIHSQKIVRL